MKYSNELKVGIAIVVSIFVMILGIRFFKDIPLFGGTIEYHTIAPNAKGLIPGNEVRTSGIKIGAITEVKYNQSEGNILVRFRVDENMHIPQGTQAAIGGIDALTGIKLELDLGPAGSQRIEAGGLIPYTDGGNDLISDLTTRAPLMVNKVDSVLVGLDNTLGATESLLASENSDLRKSLASLRDGTAALNRLIREEHARVSSILTNVDSLTANLDGITSENSDSIKVAISNLSAAAQSMEAGMASLDGTLSQIDSIVGKIDGGQGTLGLLINDPDLYHNLDSVASSLNELLVDLKKNPRRYLKDMSIVELF